MAVYFCLIKEIAYGWLIGLLSIFLSNILLFGFDTVKLWCHDLFLTDKIYTTSTYVIEQYIIANVPLIFAQFIPLDFRDFGKLSIYFIALILSFHILYVLTVILKRNKNRMAELMSIVYVASICITPVVTAHLIVYDLIIYIIAGVLIFDLKTDCQLVTKLKNLAIGFWFSIDVYYLFIFYICGKSTQPVFLALIILITYWQFLSLIYQQYLNLSLTDFRKLFNYRELINRE